MGVLMLSFREQRRQRKERIISTCAAVVFLLLSSFLSYNAGRARQSVVSDPVADSCMMRQKVLDEWINAINQNPGNRLPVKPSLRR